MTLGRVLISSHPPWTQVNSFDEILNYFMEIRTTASENLNSHEFVVEFRFNFIEYLSSVVRNHIFNDILI